MGAYETFGTDEMATDEGVWLDYGNFQVRVRPGDTSLNADFAKSMERLTRPMRGRMKTETLTNEESRAVLIKAYVESVITDWTRKEGDVFVKGMTGKDGKPMIFSKDNVTKTLVDLPKLFDDIVDQANNLPLFRAQLEADAGN